MDELPPSLDDIDLSSLDEEALDRLDAMIAAQSPDIGLARGADSSPTPPHCDELIRAVISARAAHLINESIPHKTIGRFEALEFIGRGGNGYVFKVFDPKLNRLAALKLCVSPRPEAGAALMKEAQTLAKIEHANIVTVYDIGEHGNDTFFVMKLVEGTSMRRYATRGETLPTWDELVGLFCVVGEALAAAHDVDIVHGDIKPSNILLDLTSKAPYLADFGHARVRHAADETSALGTLAFLAPELLRNEGVADERSDQYAFCVALWDCLDGGIPPYRGRDSEDFLIEIGQGVPTVINKAVPERVREVLRRGMAQLPSERFSSMRELVHQLRLALGPRLVEPDSGQDRSGVNSGLVTLVVVLAVGLMIQLSRAQRQQAPMPSQLEGAPQIEPAGEHLHELDLPSSSALHETGCVKSDWEPGVVAKDVCRSIRGGDFANANNTWIDAHRTADPKSAAEWAELSRDSLSISKTFFAEGEKVNASTWRHIACRDYGTALEVQAATKAEEEQLSSTFEGCD